MRRTVYIETTIPSFYFEVRTEPEMISRRDSTRRWWADEAPNYELQSSALVVGELQKGGFPGKEQALELIRSLPLLEFADEIDSIAAVYMARHLMPTSDMADAYHLAFASHYGCDFLLTWNCRHLANANKIQHLQAVNLELGLRAPIVTTPDLLLTEQDNA